jgi:thiol-disulfide isomerase/thioredoxin
MKNILIATLLLVGIVARAEALHIEDLKPLANAQKVVDADRVFVYFWASWCPDCREKLTHGDLQALQSEFPKVKVLTVNADRDEKKGKDFIETEKLSLPVYRDDEKTLAKNLKLFAVPAWAVLSKNGNQWTVAKSSTGSDLTDIRNQLKALK